MTNWVRLWEDMPTDPKWRVISRRSGRPLPEVISVFICMMTNAGSNTDERGSLTAWDDEDIAAALDMESENVAAIRAAMQGKTLDGERLTGWERRQPKREDGSAERAAAWREQRKRQNEQDERTRTHANARKRPETETETDSDTKDKSFQDLLSAPPAATDAPADELKIKRERKLAECEAMLREVGEGWNEIAASLRLPQIGHLTQSRKVSVLARAKDFREIYGYSDPLEGFRELFSRIRGSPFLRGDTGKFRADFDFAMRQSSFTKIMEGKYADQQEARCAH